MPPNGPTTTNRMTPTTTTTPKSRAKKETLHFLAASSSTTSVDAARALLERGANVNAIDRDGATPLHFACVHDNVAMAQLLLTFGADPMSADKLGRTAYSIAKGNTLRFLRRYRKKDKQQRLGFFRRFFACHSRNDTFFVVRHQNPSLNPTSLAEVTSTSFNRGNTISKSYRNAKKKIRATFHAFKRSNSNATLEDVVLTSEGLKTVVTPLRAKKAATPKRSMSLADLAKIPDRRAIRDEDKNSPVKPKSRARARTPEAIRKTPKSSRPRSKSQETTLKAMPAADPMSYYNHPRAKVAGLRPALPEPSAPPLSPPTSRKTRSKSPMNTTAYFTAEESLELIGNDMEKLALTTTPKTRKKKSPTPEEQDASEDVVVLTPNSVNDGEERKIRRLRDGEFRTELKKFGISPAGPLDARTRRLYEKKLLSERRKILSRGYSPDSQDDAFKYSPQLDLVLRTGGFLPPELLLRARKSDDIVREEFRGIGGYTAFCYLIMDPRVLGTNDAEKVSFSQFVASIFYVGKGSKNRPLQHFIDARNERRDRSEKLKSNEKLKTIDELWTLGHGIPRHEISHGISDEEAYVREASLIEAIKLSNLSNKKAGEFHGASKNWDKIAKAEYGTFLLHRALATLKIEGIKLITETNLPDSIYPYVTNRRPAGVRTPKTPK